MLHFFNLIRWKNLALIMLTQVLIKYALFDSYNIDTALNDFQFSLLVIATVLIAAAGNIINDIFDIEADTINKPEKVIINKSISEKVGFNLYLIFTVIGVGIGFYLANTINRSGLATMFVIISALLYVYSTYLKRIVLIGNISISILIVLSILIIGLFDIMPHITPQNKDTMTGIMQILLGYSFFAFILNFIREIIKDIEDMNGDYNAGMKTLPIVLGKERSTMVSFTLSLIPLFVLGYYIIEHIYNQQLVVIYFLVFVLAPMIYLSIKLFLAEHKNDYKHISVVLKLIMLFGVLSLLLYPLIINNA